MNLQPLLDAPAAVQIHVAAVLPAAVLGLWLLVSPKGDRLHRLLGKVWMALMATTALSSFFIHQLNLFYGFSPIHFLSLFVLFGIWRAIAAARAHDIRAHRAHVLGLYFGGIVLAGLFTLAPGRIMNAVVFDDGPSLGLLMVLGGITVLMLLQRRLPRRGA